MLIATNMVPDPHLQVSRTLGSHMVLQRAPAAAVVWGHVGPGESVVVTGLGVTVDAMPDADGTWRARLPPTPAGGPYSLTVKASGGAVQTLTDVLFGDVYLCGGQSNMQFAMPEVTNATAEIAAADGYPCVVAFDLEHRLHVQHSTTGRFLCHPLTDAPYAIVL